MPYLLVEYDHDPPISDEQLMAGSAALTPCLEARKIKRLRSWLSTDRRQGVCEYYAPDAESLREAYHTAKVRFKRVWPAILFEGVPPPDLSPGATQIGLALAIVYLVLPYLTDLRRALAQ